MAKRKQILTENVSNKETIIDNNISDFFNTKYLDYVIYANTNRAIPHIIDGLKTGARKLLFAGMSGPFKSGKPDKLISLVGDTLRLAQYQHGDASLHNSIVELSSAYKNNLNPYVIDGQGGTLRDNDAVGAPRYLYIALNKYAKLIYGIDEDLLNYMFDDGYWIEPEHYLPIIPTVLTNRNTGIGVGYAFTGFSYNPLDIINACIYTLLSGEESDIHSIRPYVRGCKKENFIFNEDKWRWESFGEYEAFPEKNMIIIKDLPFDIEFKTYEKHLKSLESNDFIKKWEDETSDDKIRYKLYFKPGVVNNLIDDTEQLVKKLMLSSFVEKDNLTVLNEHKRLITFDNTPQLLNYFVNLRLTFYFQRKSKMVDAIKQKIEKASTLAKFIKLVIDKKIKIANEEIEIVKERLREYSLPESCLDLKISRITKTEYDEQLHRIKELNEELVYIKNTGEKQMYINDLCKLYKSLENDFL